MTRHLLGILFLGAVIVSGAPTAIGAAEPSRLPLDPLSAEEKAIAEKLVRADQRAQELIGERATLVSIEFLAMKGREADDAVRHADLLFVRPDAELGARAIVRLGATPSIVEFTRIDRKSVPMTDADVQEAWKIALADSTYRRRLTSDLDRLKPEALRIYTEDREDPLWGRGSRSFPRGTCLFEGYRTSRGRLSALSAT